MIEQLDAKEEQLINQVNNFELKLIRLKPVKVAFKIGNYQAIKDGFKLNQIGCLYKEHVNDFIDSTNSDNVELFVQKLIKFLKPSEF